MKQTTRAAIAAICASDETIKPGEITRALNALDGVADAGAALPLPPLTAKEAARVLRCSTRCITNYANAGMIRRIYGPNNHAGRGCGVKFNRADVERLAQGEAPAIAEKGKGAAA